MTARIFLLIAARNLVQARRRTLLLGAAIGLVTALLVLLLGLSAGLSENIVRSATTLSSGHVNIGGFYKASPGDAMPIVTEVAKLRAVVERRLPGVQFIDRARGWCKLVSDTTAGFAGISGVDAAQETRLRGALTLAPERDYKEGGGDARPGDLSKLGTPGSIVVFASQAKRLGLAVGDAVTLTAQSLRGANNSTSATVVAICEDIGLLSSWTTFVSKQSVLELYQLRDDASGALMLYLDDVDRAAAVASEVRTMLEEEGYRVMEASAKPFWQKFEPVMGEDWTGQKLDVTTWQDEVSFAAWVVTGFDTVSGLLMLILCVIIVIGIMNTMWIAVRERTGEVGTLRAIGMSRGRVLAMFLGEATLLGLCATGVGAAFGAMSTVGLNALEVKLPWVALKTILMSDRLYLSFRPVQLAIAVGGLTLITAVAALFPALRAAWLRPVTALQSLQ